MPGKEREDSPKGQEDTTKSQQVVPKMRSDSQNPSGRRSPQEGDLNVSVRRMPIDLFNTIGVIASVIGVIIVYCLTTNQIKQSRESFIIAHRPWVGLKYIHSVNWKSEVLQVKIVVENYGRTPAFYVEGGEYDSISIQRPAWKPHFLGSRKSVALIPPHDTLSQMNKVHMSMAQYKDIIRGTKRLYIAGLITYTSPLRDQDTTTFECTWNGKYWYYPKQGNRMK